MDLLHSSEITGLCLMKLSSEVLQPYFCNKKTQIIFSVFVLSNFGFLTVDMLEMKIGKNYLGFLISKIWQILKHFNRSISSSRKLLFLKSVWVLEVPWSNALSAIFSPYLMIFLSGSLCRRRLWVWNFKKLTNMAKILKKKYDKILAQFRVNSWYL